MSRTRHYTFSHPGGGTRYREFLGTVVTDEVQAPWGPQISAKCVDDTGRTADHPLMIDKFDLSGLSPLTGEYVTANSIDRFGGYIPSAAKAAPGFGIFSLPSTSAVATAAIALSNPSRPYVSIPNFLFEFKDLPAMLRDIGRFKSYAKGVKYGSEGLGPSAKDSVNHYLAYQMGWVPLISDLRKLVRFRQAVDRRINDLDRLFNQNKGLRRSVGKENVSKGRQGMWKQTKVDDRKVAISSLGPGINVRQVTLQGQEMWATVRWKATQLPSAKWSHQKLSRTARNLVFGLNVNPKALWDAFPWSWLVDWYANVGDFLEAHHNAIPLTRDSVCVMRHSWAFASWTRIDQYVPYIRGGEGSATAESKARFLGGGPVLSATLPFISGRQFSILGALAIQRFARGRV